MPVSLLSLYTSLASEYKAEIVQDGIKLSLVSVTEPGVRVLPRRVSHSDRGLWVPRGSRGKHCSHSIWRIHTFLRCCLSVEAELVAHTA